MQKPKNSRTGRAAAMGLAVGLAASCVALAVMAALRFNFDCGPLTSEECALEAQLARDLGRLQLLSSLGLGAVAVGVFLWLRKETR